MTPLHPDCTPLVSSLLASLRYMSDTTLELEFRTGARYHYFGVPRTIVEGLVVATSKGRYFNRHIRGRFHYQRVA